MQVDAGDPLSPVEGTWDGAAGPMVPGLGMKGAAQDVQTLPGSEGHSGSSCPQVLGQGFA